MNGFADHHLSEANFEAPSGGLRSFDAFPKTKQTYLTRASKNGGVYTGLLVLLCTWLTSTEVTRWFRGETRHAFSVERGVGHTMNMNLDIVIPVSHVKKMKKCAQVSHHYMQMRCEDLHVNVQDASGDRILAGDTLHKDVTTWKTWTTEAGRKTINRKWGVTGSNHGAREEREGGWTGQQAAQYERVEDVHDYLAAAKGKKRFMVTPKIRGSTVPDSCRIFGTIEGNKVQGDFHITARGHGYAELGQHLDHDSMSPTSNPLCYPGIPY